jgi:hypothetical protein
MAKPGRIGGRFSKLAGKQSESQGRGPITPRNPSYPSAKFMAGSLGGRKTKRPEGRMFIGILAG